MMSLPFRSVDCVHSVWSLAQANPRNQSGNMLDVLLWGGVLVAIVVVGWIVILRVRRSLTSKDSGVTTGFSLQDLRTMHARGEISTDEFDQAREAMIRSLRRDTSENTPPNGQNGNSDF